jgi:hypothetical protein
MQDKLATCKICGKIMTTPQEAINHLLEHPEEFAKAVKEVLKGNQARDEERLR